MARLHLGQATIRGGFSHYARFFDLVELGIDLGNLPKPARAREWRASVPEGFVFSVRLPRSVGAFRPSEQAERELARTLRAAELLEAGWLVLRTPATVTPAPGNRRRLAELCGELLGHGPRVAWEPEGLWEPRAAEKLAHDCGVHLVRDLGREDASSFEQVYARLRSIGSGGRVSGGALERAAERLVDCDESYVVLEGQAAAKAALQLRGWVAELSGQLGEDWADDALDDEEPALEEDAEVAAEDAAELATSDRGRPEEA